MQIRSYYFLGEHEVLSCLSGSILIEVNCWFIFLKLTCINLVKKTPHLVWVYECLIAITCQIKIFVTFIFLKLIFIFLIYLISIYFKIIDILINNCRSFTYSYWVLFFKMLYLFFFIILALIFFWFLFFFITFFYWIFKFCRWIVAKWRKLFFHL